MWTYQLYPRWNQNKLQCRIAVKFPDGHVAAHYDVNTKHSILVLVKFITRLKQHWEQYDSNQLGSETPRTIRKAFDSRTSGNQENPQSCEKPTSRDSELAQELLSWNRSCSVFL